MPDGRALDGHARDVRAKITISRRQAVAGGAALAAAGVTVGIAVPAGATSTADQRLRTFEGRYAIDGHRVIHGYFATPRGRTGMDVLVVIPGKDGLDESVRDAVRRHALAGKLVLAPDLAKTAGNLFESREATVADLLPHLPRLGRHARGNGTVTVVAA